MFFLFTFSLFLAIIAQVLIDAAFGFSLSAKQRIYLLLSVLSII